MRPLRRLGFIFGCAFFVGLALFEKNGYDRALASDPAMWFPAPVYALVVGISVVAAVSTFVALLVDE